MKKISQEAAQAFWEPRYYHNKNTKVIRYSQSSAAAMYLHGNLIAWRKNDNRLHFSFDGWQTVTTKERLNAVLPKGYWLSFKDGEIQLHTPAGIRIIGATEIVHLDL